MAQMLAIALDSSEGAWHAVEYVARTFGNTPGVKVTLLHILSGLPPAFWDDGHILDNKERDSRERMKAGWQAEREKAWQGLVEKARKHLAAAGFAAGAVASHFSPRYFDIAEDLVNEAMGLGCSTIIMGRRGLGAAKTLLLGSVTNKVVQNSRGLAVTIVT